ncbi:MAG: DUF4058 family protein [Pirellula sp.]
MKSPFPGVDPYLEQHWGDVHTRLMVYISDQISDQLPSDLQARVEESVMVDLDESSRWIYPDVQVTELPLATFTSSVAVADAIIAEPTIIPLPNEQPTQRHIEIVDLNSGNRVVTAIELLSPANKQEEAGRAAYRRKQREYFEGGVNLVEIDFIRSGTFIVAAPERGIPLDKRTPYLVCIRRANRPEQAEIISIALNQAVPNFRMPLRATDPDIVLQLQPLLDACYRRGRYGSIDYSQPPRPKLDDQAAAWAIELLRGKRCPVPFP